MLRMCLGVHLFWLAHRQKSERLLYCDHVAHDGEGLFRLACEHDLEGVVAKRKYDPYLRHQASWLKIRNHDYSQWAGREELFERDRHSELAPGWHRMGRIDGVQCLARGKSASYVRRELRLSGNLSD